MVLLLKQIFINNQNYFKEQEINVHGTNALILYRIVISVFETIWKFLCIYPSTAVIDTDKGRHEKDWRVNKHSWPYITWEDGTNGTK